MLRPGDRGESAPCWREFIRDLKGRIGWFQREAWLMGGLAVIREKVFQEEFSGAKDAEVSGACGEECPLAKVGKKHKKEVRTIFVRFLCILEGEGSYVLR